LSLDNNSVLQSNGITDMVTNTTIAQSINSDLQIQIQKSSELEAIATIQLPDNMSLKITKDVENDNKIGINLEPAGLGNVELVIETNKDNAVTAVIRSDKAEILDHLRKESASLERYLAEAGLNLGGQGLSFEQRQQQDDNNQNQNHSDTFTASISEAKLTDTQNNQLMTTTEKLYAHLDKQSAQQGLDIRL
jgi:flagellar hook-length control protein FliK